MYINAVGRTLLLSGAIENTSISGATGSVRSGSLRNDGFNGLPGETLIGKAGDDTYTLFQSGIVVTEAANEGIDTVIGNYFGTVVLSANVDNVVLESEGAISATGNNLDNILIAGISGASLDGAKGNDVLVGGAGADVFRVKAGNGSDAIEGFRPDWDAIDITGYGLTSYAQLKGKATQVGADVKIALSASESLVIRNTKLADLSAHDFNFPTLPAAGPGEGILDAPAEVAYSRGWIALNNTWGVDDLVMGRDYVLQGTYDPNDMTRGTTYNWSFPLKASSNSILAYPEIIAGLSPFSSFGNPTDMAKALPVKISDLTSASSRYDTTFSGTLSGFNVAYDIWLSESPTAIGRDAISNEIMVWIHKGDFDVFGEEVGTYSKNGFTAKIYHKGTYTAVVADQDSPKGTLDILDMLKTLTGLGIVSTKEYLRSVELGAEIVSGTGSLAFNNFDVQVDAVDRVNGGKAVTLIDGSATTTSRYDGTGALLSVEKLVYGSGGNGQTEYYDNAQHILGKDVAANSQAGNSAPEIIGAPQTFSALAGFGRDFPFQATDSDGDVVTYNAGTAAHGTVTGAANGVFTYTPNAGYHGTDTISATASDGQGGTVTRTFPVSAATIDRSSDWLLYIPGDFAAEIGGTGSIFGTAAYQAITIVDEPGTVRLDASFNRGGDMIRLSGKASDWQIVRSGSSAILMDGDTMVSVPVGTTGLSLAFEDGERALKLDSGSQVFEVGSQSFSSTLVPITALPNKSVIPSIISSESNGNLFLSKEKSVMVGGDFTLYGTAGSEKVHLLHGEIKLDPSFNRGNDLIILEQITSAFTAKRHGSQAIFSSTDLTFSVSVGTEGMGIRFADGSHELRYDLSTQSIFLDEFRIDILPTLLSNFI